MRALTLWRPWEIAILSGSKTVENRSWPPPKSVIGTRIALHAGKKYDYVSAEAIKQVLGLATIESTPGVIVGTVLIAGYVKIGTKGRDGTATSPELLPLLKSVWFFGEYGWALQDVRALAKPVPCKGMQGLWVVPPEIEAEVLRQEQGRTRP
jgi:hypothetical protein